jgi:hypothetical protein
MMMRWGLGLLGALMGMSVLANDFVIDEDALQSDFRAVSKDIAAALSYKSLSPAAATGISGFGLGAVATYAPVNDKQAWRDLTGGRSVSALGMVGLSAAKGLPGKVDVGGFFAQVPSTDARMLGGEVRYAILPGGVATPALAVRVAHSRMSGVDDFGFRSTIADVSVSKGFTLLTPYAGVGRMFAKTSPSARTRERTGLHSESVDAFRAFAGLRVSLGLLALTPEYERIGSNDAFNLRLGLSF